MRAFDNQSSVKILLKAAKFETNENRVLYVFAGPNGSGKSTLIANKVLSGEITCPYINADLYCLTEFANIKDVDEKNEKVMYFTMQKVERLIEEGKSFCYETVLSHPSKLELMKKAKENGFKIVATFVYTKNPDINIERVALRASQGGHDVPKDKIRARYYRSVENAQMLKTIADEFYTFDNSEDLSIEKYIYDDLKQDEEK